MGLRYRGRLRGYIYGLLSGFFIYWAKRFEIRFLYVESSLE